MGFGNFLRGIVAQLTPSFIDHGQTYGTFNQKKKPEPGDPGYSAPAPSAPGSNSLTVQQPTNHFDTGISTPTLPGAPKTAANPLQSTYNLAPLKPLQPGTVVHPNFAAPAQQTITNGAPATPNNQPPGARPGFTPPAPGTHAVVAGTPGTYVKGGFIPDNQPKKPGFWGKVGNGLKTAGETAVGTVANIPEVGLAAGRTISGIAQGVTELPHVVTATAATATQKLNNMTGGDNRFLHAINTGVQRANTDVKGATNWVDTPLNAVNRGLDRAANAYAQNVPFANGGDKTYRYTQIPLNVLAALATAGGSTAADVGEAGDAAQGAEKAGLISRILNKPLTSNPDNLIARTGQAVTRPTAPVVHAINTPFSTGRNAITRFLGNNRNLAGIENDVVDAGEAGNLAADAGNAGQTTQIPVTQEGGNVPIPVRTPQPGALIRENSGDAQFPGTVPTPEQVTAARVRNAFDNQAPGAPDQSVSGIVNVPRTKPFSVNPEQAGAAQNGVVDSYAAMLKDMGEGNGTQLVPDGEGGYYRTTNNFRTAENSGKRMTKQDWVDQARSELETGRAEPGHQQAFNDANNPDVQSLLSKGDTTVTEPPQGSPIQIKSVKGIPVEDQTVVPAGQVSVPGEVRPTVATDPNAAKTAAALANAPVVNTPPSLPQEVQKILDNPRQFNKRQVAAARNQRKMANAVAKANEDTKSAVDRIDVASPAAQSGEGFVGTGEFARSQQGGAYQKVSRATEMQQAVKETANLSPADVIKTARTNQAETGGFNRRDIRNIAALFEQKRIPRGTEEWNQARQILKEDGTIWGQTGALRNYTMRRTASSDELVSRFESKVYRMAEDPSKIDGKLFDQVDAAESKFTDTRDAALQAYNRFTEAPTTQNAKIYHAAQDAADAADKEARMTEFKVAKTVLKGNKDVKQARELEKMAQQADLYQMDSVDASMLSGTGTFTRNFVNAAIGNTEEGIFGKAAARITGKLTGESVGGGYGRGNISGFRKGAGNLVDASKARAGNAGFNPLEHIKNWATTGNELGDTLIDSQINRNVLDHYTQMLKGEGYTGRELRDRAGVVARQDPSNVGRLYQQQARIAAGLGGGITRGNKIETIVKNGISDAISLGHPNAATETAAKLITRMTLGFPTAIGRSVNEGIKRFTLGAPTFLKAIATKDPQARAILIKEGIKQAGTGGLVIPPLFYALGASGAITGGYPSDPAERARWQREGISENSINIGGNYYQLPAYLGSWAVPGLFYASLGRNGGDWAAAAKDTAKIVPSILPTDQLSNVSDVINGRSDLGKFMAQTGASAVRALEPGGALLNEVAKSFDPTQNDTSHGTVLQNFVDKVMSGIPGENKFANIPDKVDDSGNVLHNPSAAALAVGATSTTQNKGVQETNTENNQTNDVIKGMSDLGAFSDPNLKAVVATDKKTKAIYDKIIAGKQQANPDEIKKLQEAMTKGVSTTGEDTSYLEKEQYDTNLAALNMKRQLMAADPTTKPSDLKKMDTAIKRGQVYKDNTIPYDAIQQYEGTSVGDWRAMGDSTNDNYDPETYQKLWAIDQLMAQNGVSYNKNNESKQKYSQKAEGKGRGGNAANGFTPDFGKIGNLTGMPTVQQYQTIDKRSGAIPTIDVQLPNIVHKIGSSG